MTMNWQILVLLSVVFMSAGSILQKVVMREDKSDPWAYSILFQFLVGLMVFVIGFLFSDMSFPADWSTLILNLKLMILLWSGANYFIYSALKSLEASTFNIIFSGRSLFTVFASTIFLGEFLNSRQYIGIVGILVGISIALFNKNAFKKLDKGVYLAIFAAICFGFANTNDRVLLGSFNLYPYVTLSFLLPAISMAVIKPRSLYNLKDFINNKLLLVKMLFLAIFYTVASTTFFSALQIAPNSSRVVAISVSTVILTVILSIIFLKERSNVGRKIVGAIISFLGLLLVS